MRVSFVPSPRVAAAADLADGADDPDFEGDFREARSEEEGEDDVVLASPRDEERALFALTTRFSWAIECLSAGRAVGVGRARDGEAVSVEVGVRCAETLGERF
jgi:hypothetical protein